MVSLFFGFLYSDTEFQIAESLPNLHYEAFIDSRTGEPASDNVINKTSWYEPQGSVLLPSLMGVFVLSLVVITLASRLYERKKHEDYNEAASKHNARIETLLSRLSFVSASGAEAAPPRDVCLAFSYLNKEQLALLNFPQLKEVHKQRNESFQKALKACSFSKNQSDIWRLFSHIVKASSCMQCEILAHAKSRALIRRSDPRFFQLLMAQLKPSEARVMAVCIDILQKDILSEKVAADFKDEQLSYLIMRLAHSEELEAIVPAVHLSSLHPTTHEKDTYETFLHTKKLTLYSIEEAYNYYRRSLKDGDLKLIAWFESYLANHLDFFVRPSELSDVLVELSDFKADGLKLKIDAHLAQEGTFPPFNTGEFDAAYQFSKTHNLYLYEHALESSYSRALHMHQFQGNAEGMCQEIGAFLQQFQRLFASQAQDLQKVLASRLIAFLRDAPQKMNELVLAAEEHLEVLKLIIEIYRSNPLLFSKYCLFPLEEVIS